MVKNKSNQKTLITVLVCVVVVLVGALVFVTAGDNIGTVLSKLSGNKVVTVPAGSQLNIVLASSVSSGLNKSGDIISGNLLSPVVIGEDVVVPAGSQVSGKVLSVAPAERFQAGKGGYLEIKFDSVQTPEGKKYSISTPVFKFYGGAGKSRLAKDAITGAAAGAALGTAVGAIAGGKKAVGRGAWSGAAIGGGIGASKALISKGQEAFVQSGANLTLTLEEPIQVIAQKR
ncbi:MAG: hypothetical protein HYR97_07725 [Candidatus Melainabacteria bacterium]|nr:hypothetical protein [Candidatus Melainabacteria bacterium]MBI3307979.1 hypothetical protein [Candidatus Melainabacteria bacterium]